MLLRFGVSNFFSVYEYSELSLVASKAIKDTGLDLLVAPSIHQASLPVILIYGANAAGKTSAWLALRSMKEHVTGSFKDLDPEDEVPNTQFVLHPSAESEPSRFDCDFLIDGVRYHYGFEILGDVFSAEWLHYYPEGSRRTLFERGEDLDQTVFGPSFRGQKKNLLAIARDNCLIVSAGASISHEQLSVVQKFFRQKLAFVGPGFNPSDAVPRGVSEIASQVVDFLKLSDTGVVSAKIEYEEPPEEAMQAMESFRQAMMPVAESTGAELAPIPSKIPRVFLGHRAADEAVIDIPLGAESRGTIRLVSLMRHVFAALDAGRVLFIDEIDASLHPAITHAIVRLFSSRETNPHGAQLIATTHETNLLCADFLRRDQIWFAEKSEYGSTIFYPLTDIKTRNTDNIQKGYLQGRFGAIPFIGDVAQLMNGAD